MALAKINMPGGISVQVDGTPNEVAAVLDHLKQKFGNSPQIGTSRHPKKLRGEIPGLVEGLKAEEFFKSPKGLSAIQQKLAELGHHYPVTTLSGAMQAQSRTRNLRRFKQNGKYVYVQ
jgi:superfamily II DNA/RNA helicase